MYKDPATGQSVNGLKDTSYTHDALIDAIIANPAMDQKDLARSMGYSEGWISIILSSDSFQSAFAKRKEEVIDPEIRTSLETQFKGLVLQSAAVLRRKLEANPSDQLALRVMENASKALGYGARIKVDGEVRHTHSLIQVLASLPQGPAPREPRTIEQLPAPKESSAG